MQRTIFTFLMLLFSTQGFASASDLVNQLIDNPQQVGKTSRMTYLFWDVYDASLYAPQGAYSKDQPFVLALHYLRALDGKEIAKRSLKEMEKQGLNNSSQGEQWLAEMEKTFPDVSKGTVLFGVRTPEGTTQFYQDKKLIGEVKDSEFTIRFFNIWLGEKTSEPTMRAELLGLKRK
ncbi:chalcone isomerase family protein [Pseudoalteromonas piscicida]|uniref:chalcone isomerase family protein n=1 Tax=Pseudoalteromonas piscicida TaxID=43662 RepID=UPI001EFD2D39|nr:chalcone isomerase family protein [Pseudoalteromonas piscicida]MCG9768278.1 chalcone isomerase family protein [Pseudoalteromonas piscicida]